MQANMMTESLLVLQCSQSRGSGAVGACVREPVWMAWQSMQARWLGLTLPQAFP